jgi:hypothetical protein
MANHTADESSACGQNIMRDTVGFRSYIALFHPKIIKRDALMFKRIGIVHCDSLCQAMQNGSDEVSQEPFFELPWLIEQGIVFDPLIEFLDKGDSLDEDTKQEIDNVWEVMAKYQEDYVKFTSDKEKFINLLKQIPLQYLDTYNQKDRGDLFNEFLYALFNNELFLRVLSAFYRSKRIDAYPIISGILPELQTQSASVEEVIRIGINQLPTPDDSTSWEQIMDFRNDPDTENKFLAFRNWRNEISRAKLTPLEIEQKLEWLLQEYQQHMELHRMKTNVSTLETILVSMADRKFGDIVKGLFSVKYKQIALLEAESKSPGKEVAFISKANETFR